MRSSVAWSRCIFLPLMVHVSSVPDLDDRYRTPVVHIVGYPVLTYPDTLPFFSPELAAVPRTRGASAMSSMARLRRSAFWVVRASSRIFRLNARPLCDSSTGGFFVLGFDLLPYLLPGNQFIFPARRFSFGLIIAPDILQIFQGFDPMLELLYRQDDAHALAVLVHDVTGFHQFASLSL